MTRLTDNDRRWWRLTWGKTDTYRPLRLTFCTGGDDDDDRPRNSLTAWAFGRVVRLSLPTLMQPFRVKHIATTWDAATVARMGRNWYYEYFPREYGFSVSDGFLQVFLGPQTNDSTTTKSWSKFLPWTQWRWVRESWYGLDGEHVHTVRKTKVRGTEITARVEFERSGNLPHARFAFTDHDGQQNTVSTHISEMEWRFGEGWFKWLSLFRRPRIRRALILDFDKEVGPEKGSWKGGLMGTSIEMLPGELHEAAFRRYCEQEHRAKYGKYRIAFVSAV